MLSSRPQSVEDITIAQKNWQEIDGRRDNMQAKSKGLLDLGSILGLHATGEALACFSANVFRAGAGCIV